MTMSIPARVPIPATPQTAPSGRESTIRMRERASGGAPPSSPRRNWK